MFVCIVCVYISVLRCGIGLRHTALSKEDAGVRMSSCSSQVQCCVSIFILNAEVRSVSRQQLYIPTNHRSDNRGCVNRVGLQGGAKKRGHPISLQIF